MKKILSHRHAERADRPKAMHYFLVLLVLAVLFETLADSLFKSWSLNDRSLLLWIGMGIYIIGTFIWAYSLKFGFLSKAISIFTVLNLVGVLLVGILYFNEKLNTANKIGIILGVLSVVLLQM